MKKYIPLFYTVAFLMLGDILVMAGQTTLTTYYPAPSGNYNHLTTSNIGIGTVTSANALEIKGYGPIKLKAYEQAKVRETKLLAQLRAPAPEPARHAAE